jgi:hypothetical protein
MALLSSLASRHGANHSKGALGPLARAAFEFRQHADPYLTEILERKYQKGTEPMESLAADSRNPGFS